MKNNDWKERLNIVYSTNPDYKYELEEAADELPGKPKEKQAVRVSLDKRNRKGKTVTLITGFELSAEALEELGRLLKVKCGVGGSAKEGEIVLQGDFRNKVMELLHKEGYTKTRII
jgi:translation initiation factor 1